MEIYKLSDKSFRVNFLKKFSGLQEYTKRQSNKLGKPEQGKFNKEIDTIKKTRNSKRVTELKDSMESFKSRLKHGEESVNV